MVALGGAAAGPSSWSCPAARAKVQHVTGVLSGTGATALQKCPPPPVSPRLGRWAQPAGELQSAVPHAVVGVVAAVTALSTILGLPIRQRGRHRRHGDRIFGSWRGRNRRRAWAGKTGRGGRWGACLAEERRAEGGARGARGGREGARGDRPPIRSIPARPRNRDGHRKQQARKSASGAWAGRDTHNDTAAEGRHARFHPALIPLLPDRHPPPLCDRERVWCAAAGRRAKDRARVCSRHAHTHAHHTRPTYLWLVMSQPPRGSLCPVHAMLVSTGRRAALARPPSTQRLRPEVLPAWGVAHGQHRATGDSREDNREAR